MSVWFKRVRGAIGVALLWGVAWAVIGGTLMEGVIDRGGRILDMWPQVLAVLGFASGAAFSLVLSLAASRRESPEFTLRGFAMLGAIAGAIGGGTAALLFGAPWFFPAATLLAGALSGVGSLGAVRFVERRMLGGERDRDGKLIGALVLALLGTAPLAAQSPDALPQALDSIAQIAVNRYHAAGTVAAVTRGNDTLLFKAYGKADVEWDVAMPVDAMFEIGSQAKQFTAVAVLQLRDAGKLALDDDLTRWLPDFDTRGHRVTLRHLLDHTSGIHDLTETPEFPVLIANRVWPRDSAYALIKRQPFDFAPGTAQRYSNSGFWLLGLVIEKASGVSYEEYVEQRIFAPLGMNRSMYCNSFENVPRRAHGYGLREGQLLRAPTNIHTWSFAAGALCSTAGDLLTWLRALHGGKVLSPASYQEMMTPSRLGNGMTLRYGLGVGVERDFEGRRVINHGGVLAGFWSESLWYPDEQLAAVVLMNTTGGLDPEEIARMLAERVIPPVRTATAKYDGDPTPFLGRYQGETVRGPFTIEVSKGTAGLMVSGNGSPPRPLLWLGERTFFFNGIYLTFAASEGGAPAAELGFNPAKGMFAIFRRE